jgi:hypothetical protein
VRRAAAWPPALTGTGVRRQEFRIRRILGGTRGALLIAPLVGTVLIGAGPAALWLACGLTGLGAALLMTPRSSTTYSAAAARAMSEESQWLGMPS